MNYFLAPRSGEKSYKNFQSTIKNGVPLERIERFLSDEGKSKLDKEDVIYAWGNREGTKTQWERMQYGDTVLFYAKRKLVIAGEVYFKQESKDLALSMWPPDENGNPWRFTFFIKNLRYISIPMQAFNAIVGFKSNYIVQGFIQLKEERVESIATQFGSMENMLDQFQSNISEEVPTDNETVYVNVSKEIEPEIIFEPKIVPKQLTTLVKKTERTPYKTDYVARSKANAITGSKGEELVLKEEKKRLKKLGKFDLANKVLRVSVDDDSKGYDIHSFEEDGRDRYIEVKTSTSKGNSIRFFMSQNEYNAARTLSNYFVYFVDGINDKCPRVTQIKEPIKKGNFLVTTDTYVVEGMRK